MLLHTVVQAIQHVERLVTGLVNQLQCIGDARRRSVSISRIAVNKRMPAPAMARELICRREIRPIAGAGRVCPTNGAPAPVGVPGVDSPGCVASH